ncbi:MAG TPA: feruloyl-CoA synthase [Candidatus Baltobacteraceae bacterium]|nr:feruloyl-CoA synthase [Candidatus Baltobacteraceae bacterium]
MALGPLFSEPDLELIHRGDGAMLLRSRVALEPYPDSIGAILRRWARERGERPFIGYRAGRGWRTVTYAEMLDRVRHVAAALLELGLGPDKPVAILSEASIAHATVSLGALYAGIPVAPISPAYSTAFGDLRRLEFVLDALRPGLVFAADADAYRGALGLVDDATPVAFERGAPPRAGALTLDRLVAAASVADADAAAERVRPDDVAKILFTSGSTGEPKGVLNTHRMLCSNQQSLVQIWPFLARHDFVLVDWLPWHHTFGGNHNFNMALFHGGTLYLDDGKPMPGRFERSVEALAEHRPTVYFNVPRGHKMLVDALNADESFAQRFFSRLLLIGNAAAALPATTWNALRELAARYGGGEIPVTGSWGLTETAPMVTAVHYPLRDPADVGVPAPGAELLLAPFENKLEVRVRGPMVTPGYWGRPDLTAAAFDDEGFYRTGDALRFADPEDPVRGVLFDGRIAENFKLTTGTWVDAGAVRVALLGALGTIIDEAVVAGENRDEIGVLLFVGPRVRDAYDDEALRGELQRLLHAYNAGATGSSHRVGRALVVFDALSPADGEVTDKGSVNQRRVLARRAALVDRLFSADDAAVIVAGEAVA